MVLLVWFACCILYFWESMWHCPVICSSWVEIRSYHTDVVIDMQHCLAWWPWWLLDFPPFRLWNDNSIINLGSLNFWLGLSGTFLSCSNPSFPLSFMLVLCFFIYFRLSLTFIHHYGQYFCHQLYLFLPPLLLWRLQGFLSSWMWWGCLLYMSQCQIE